MKKAASEIDFIDFRIFNKAAEIYRALNHTVRINILLLLDRKPRLSVTEIFTALDVDQAVCSQHLGLLRKAGLVVTEKEDRHVYYKVNQNRINELHKLAEQIASPDEPQ